MPLRRNRFTGFIVLLSSFALVSLAGSVFYYVKLRQNESFQTQLHLRELQRVANSLDQSINSIKKSIDTDIESSRTPKNPTIGAQVRQQPFPAATAEALQSDADEFSVLKEHLKTAFPNVVAEPPPENAGMGGKGDYGAETCRRRNATLAIVDGTDTACAVDEQATLISQNFYWSPVEVSLPCSAPAFTAGDSNIRAAEIRRLCPLASRHIARLKIPLNDLASPSSLMPLVILTDESGTRIHSWENVRNHATQSSIHYRSAKALLQQVNAKQRGVSETGNARTAGDADQVDIGYSDFVDLEIAGERYRAYVMPWSKVPYLTGVDCDADAEITDGCNLATDRPSDYFLIGLQPYASLLGSKLSVSHSIVVLLLLTALLFVALLPVVKLQLVSPQQAFTQADRQALVFGSLVFTALLALSGYHYILYSGLKDQLNMQASNVHRQMSSRFKEEIITWRRLAEAAKQYREDAGDNGRRCPDGGDLLLNPEVFEGDTFIEGMFVLGQNGRFEQGSWSHSRHCRPSSNIDLTHRSYYQHGMQCTGWRIDEVDSHGSSSECRGKYHIERVQNVRDSRLNTWLSLPLFDSPHRARSDDEEERNLLVFGGRLQTFIKPILPLHFSYLVFDNETGIVQYHSDDQASSLVDNVFVDTDNNNYLKSLINLNHETPQVFTGLYKGQEYVFSASRIIQTVPWTLMVMYERAPFRNLNMLSVFSSLLLVLGLMTLAWLLYLLLPRACQRGLFGLLKFDRSRHTRDYLIRAALLVLLLLCLTFALYLLSYLTGIFLLGMAATMLALLAGYWWRHSRQGMRKASPAQTLESCEFKSTTYTLYIVLLLVNAVALPTLVVSEQSYRFFLNQHIALMSFDLTVKISEARRERRQYVDSFIDPDIADLQAARERHRKADMIRCHLGDPLDGLTPRCGADEGFTTRAFSYTQNRVEKTPHGHAATGGPNVVEWLWTQLNLKMDATSDFEVLAQTRPAKGTEEEAADASYRFNPDLPGLSRAIWDDRPLWILVAALLVVVLPYWLLRTRVLPNLFGLQFPDNYRSRTLIQPIATNDTEARGTDRHVAGSLLRLLDHYRESEREPVYIQLIRPGAQTRALFFDVDTGVKDAPATDDDAPTEQEPELRRETLSLLSQSPLDLNALTADPFASPQEALDPHLRKARPAGYPTLALRGLEHIPLNPVRRKRALQLLQHLVAQRTLNVILLADVSPLYRFTHPDAYPYKLDPKVLPDSEEQIAWIALFRRFTKIYDWVPALRTASSGSKAWHAFVREYEGWPELQRVAREFLAYHCAEKATNTNYSLTQALQDLELATEHRVRDPDELRSRCETLADSIDQHWTPDQVVDFFGTAAVAHYRYRWELCTTQERLLLIQLSHDNIPNPRNTVPIQHLLRRGYLYHQDGWRLANESFRNFILHAEDPAVVRGWIGDANESMWKYVRIPIFIVLLSLLGLLAYSAAEAFQSFLGIAAAVLGLVPLLLRNISLIRNPSNADT